jgi:NADPH-dependent 2,4-dienoyl-CoA reductase/sulfur reductase-like enzyme
VLIRFRWLHGAAHPKSALVFATAVTRLTPTPLLQVNTRLQTSNPDVYAVGDIALFPQPRYGGKRARQEHVQVRQGSQFSARLEFVPLCVVLRGLNAAAAALQH